MDTKTVPPIKERKTFTDYMRANTKFIIDPIVAYLARYRFSPDALTVVGMLSHFLFAWLIAQGHMTWAAVTMFFIAPLDAFDGALARKLGRKQGGFGAFLDSTLDRLAEIILFGGFILFYMAQENAVMLGVAYLAITGSIMVSYARARAEALGYSSKVGIASRVERYFVLISLLFLNLPDVALIILAVATYITVGQRMYTVWQQAYAAPDDPTQS
ncbi:MAG: CDP-alcohol phosphatidyltransferase family protein [Candidatus Promineifilaceae bacterium]